jgi:hypothetical protein
MTGTGIDYPTSRAILIGTSVYDDREFPPVPAVEHSLHGMYWALTEPSLGGWPPDRVTYWPNPRDSRSVIEDLREVARSTTGALIFYFAGHGTVAGPHSDLCLVLPDTPAKAADLYGLPIEMVRDAISQSRARTKIMILDCCYSGRAADKVLSPGTIHDIARLRGAYTLTASNLIEELARWSGNGAEPTSFTRELLEVIRTGLPGRPPVLGLHDLYPEVWGRLTTLDLPEPSASGVDWGGHFPFTLNAAHGPDGAAAAIPPMAIPSTLPSQPGPAQPGIQHPDRSSRPARPLTRRTVLVTGGTLLAGAAAGGTVGAILAQRPAPRPSSPSVVRLDPLGVPLTSSNAIWVVETGTLDGRPVAVSGAADGTILVWDLTVRARTGKPIRVGVGVRGLALTTVNGKVIAVSGSQDGRVRIWDLATRGELGPPLPHLHTANIWAVAVTAAGGTLYAVSCDDAGATRTWDITAGKSLGRLPYVPANGKGTKVWGVAATTLSDGTPAAVTGGDDATVRLWNFTNNDQVGQPITGDGLTAVKAVAVASLNGKPIAVSGQLFGDVRVWDLDAREQMGAQLGRHGNFKAGQGEGQQVWNVAIGQQRGHVIAASVGDGTPQAFDLTSGGTPLGTLQSQDNSVWGIAFSAAHGNSLAVTGCLDGRMGTYNLGPA